MLLRLIVELEDNFHLSPHTVGLMKDTLVEQIKSMLDMFTDPDELIFMVEQRDYEGNDMFWYLDEFDIYPILDCRIMDKVIQQKWQGKFEINASILDYSTSYTML